MQTSITESVVGFALLIVLAFTAAILLLGHVTSAEPVTSLEMSTSTLQGNTGDYKRLQPATTTVTLQGGQPQW